MTEESCRADVWLWRARFFRTRTLAARYLDEGRARITRGGVEGRLDKSSRILKLGDDLVFAVGGRVIAVRVVAFGERRGPPAEARGLFAALEMPQ